MHYEERRFRAQSANCCNFRKPWKERFPTVYNFHITIFHLSLRSTTDETTHAMDTRFLIIFIVLFIARCKAVNCYTYQKCQQHTHTTKKKKRRNEWDGNWCVDASHSGHISSSYAWAWFSSEFSCSKEANKANEWLDCKVFGFDAINFGMGIVHENLSFSYLWARKELGPIHDSPMLKAQVKKCIHVKRE